MFKEFRIDQVFIMKRGKEAAPNRVPDGEYNMVNETSTNNGITKRAYSENIFDGNSITVSVNYATTVFYQPEPYCASVNILILENENLDAESAMYIVAMLRKNNEKYDYNNKISKDRLAETVLSYPVIENVNLDHEYTVDDIDWQYMRDRITELERDRITELERDRITELDAYLQATGLNDYELTDEDIETISLSGFGHYEERDSEDAVKICKEMREFRCGDLFDIHPTKAYKMSNDELYQTSGNSPVLSNSSVDNGIGGYCGLDTTENGRIITFSDTTTGTDTMFYQPNSFIGYAHVQGMYPFDENWGEFQQRYFICAMKQACGTGWDYSNKFNRKLVAEMTPLLPIQTDTEGNSIIDTECKYHPDGYIPDWNFMEKYIRAIEKIVIADVVQYKDTMISKTKEVVA